MVLCPSLHLSSHPISLGSRHSIISITSTDSLQLSHTSQLFPHTIPLTNFNMVNMNLLASLALLAAPLATALPTASPETTPFSFEQWAASIGAGDAHLSVDEAIKAASASAPSSKRSLEKRLRCNHLSIPPASVPDAVTCINQLASNGQACRVEGPTVAFCTFGNAQIVGVRGSQGPTESSCNDIARAAGAVLDSCWRADNTVQGDEYAWGNGDIAVHVAAPSL